jgi:hypothetical protein
VDDALIVLVHETLKDPRNADSYEVLRELSESFANIVQKQFSPNLLERCKKQGGD